MLATVAVLSLQGFSPLASTSIRPAMLPSSAQSAPVMVLASTDQLPRTASSSTPPLAVVEEKTKSSKTSLSEFAKTVNNAAGMPLLTQADTKHAHAATAATFLISSYVLLYSGLWKEFTADDWSTFANFDAMQALMVASGIGMAGTAFPMIPKQRNFQNYAAGLRNGMMAAAISACMAAAFMIDADAFMPSAVVDLSSNVASLGIVALLYDMIVHKQPWDQRPVLADLKLELPPEASMSAQHALSIFWLASVCAGLGHLALADGTTGLTDLADDATRAFAAQLALGLAATPTVEAFFAGSLLFKDRFCKPSGEHVFTRELLGEDGEPNGEFGVRLAIQLPLQVLFSFPGPAATTVLLASASGHAEAVREFFFLA